jgi:hypothetical protein
MVCYGVESPRQYKVIPDLTALCVDQTMKQVCVSKSPYPLSNRLLNAESQIAIEIKYCEVRLCAAPRPGPE